MPSQATLCRGMTAPARSVCRGGVMCRAAKASAPANNTTSNTTNAQAAATPRQLPESRSEQSRWGSGLMLSTMESPISCVAQMGCDSDADRPRITWLTFGSRLSEPGRVAAPSPALNSLLEGRCCENRRIGPIVGWIRCAKPLILREHARNFPKQPSRELNRRNREANSAEQGGTWETDRVLRQSHREPFPGCQPARSSPSSRSSWSRLA
jgi:hypothetical protein